MRPMTLHHNPPLVWGAGIPIAAKGPRQVLPGFGVRRSDDQSSLPGVAEWDSSPITYPATDRNDTSV